MKSLLKIIDYLLNIASQLVIKQKQVSSTARNLAIIIETLSAIRYFTFLKFNFNNSSSTRLIVLSEFFKPLNPN